MTSRPDAYRWLYLDVSAGDFTAVAIFMYGAPFSARYSERASQGAHPSQHSAVNFALYRKGQRKLWVHSEYSSSAWTADGEVQIGGSTLRRDYSGRVTIELHERTAPWGSAVDARLSLTPMARGYRELALVPGMPHYWHPHAPFGHACVEVKSHGAAFDGRGYFDGNRGSELLGDELPGWRWSRVHSAKSTEVIYEPPENTIHIRSGEGGTTMSREAAQPVELMKNRWGLAVPSTFSKAKWLESSPFYARLQASPPDGEVLAEVADFRRFHQPNIRWMARFRTRVES